MLHITCRPDHWNSVVGNADAVTYLKQSVENENRPHSYLFSGRPGCGKTTLARIFANELGSSGPDLVEMDVGDFRGIDSIRDIRSIMRLKPMNSSCRVWILDECHAMTADAQRALLKALEDTPVHVYFMLATTDPMKLIEPLRDRCTSVTVSPLSDVEIKRVMLKAARQIKATAPTDLTMNEIIDLSDGSPRKALVLLEKHFGNPDAEITGISETSKEIVDLCQGLIKKQSWKAVSKILQDLRKNDVEEIRRSILGYATTVHLKTGDDNTLNIIGIFKDPFYNSGFPGLVWACAWCCKKES